MDFSDNAVDLSPRRITPLHEVRDAAKLAALVESMRADGWVGRPLLVVDYGDGDGVALTGSHRHAAALVAQLTAVPVILIPPCERLTIEPSLHGLDVYFDGQRLHEDEARIAALRELGYAEGVALMEAEFAARADE
ncbi:ParB N-terminal domain-containing protein [Myxococcus sp. CA040A]|uniref:ParB N-terminal domain-containing protein n=1 Tax=Myxococcus sp. CA040A TaxID=2741738 RepID=UPI00157B696B|nr:ParB N-terminal domain-containing protein [Myxococcus sp. CA040A]